MGRITQRVDPSALDALVERPPRVAIAFTHGDSIEAVPVAFRRDCGKLWIGIDRGLSVSNETPVPAVVVVDGGRYWFELRAITWRGRLVPAIAPPAALAADLKWFEFLVDSDVSWDYATLHEES
jgi:hypothetical protein